MEKKKKEHMVASTTNQEAVHTNDLLGKEDQNQSCVGITGGRNAKTNSPSHDNATAQNQQYPSILQWSYTTQPAMEQSPLNSKAGFPTQLPSSAVLSGWQQLSNQQTNPTNPQFQLNQMPPHLAQSVMPFWLPQRYGYYTAANASAAYQPFPHLGTTDANLQAPAIVGGGTSSKHQAQVPNFCFHVGHPYPSLAGPWDPSSWWGQAQKPQLPCSYTFPGACGYFSSQPLPTPGFSANLGQSFQRGIIRPQVKISQKHQQLWEAQSAENVQLWTIIAHLQSELADHKVRLMKLEEEISSLKPNVEEAAAQVTGTSLPVQTSKRGRPKRLLASVDALPSPDESHPRVRVRKPALCKVQSGTKVLNFERESLNSAEAKEKLCQPSAIIQHGNDEKMPNTYSANIDIHGSNPTISSFHNLVNQDIFEVDASGIGLNCSSDLKSIGDKAEDSKSAFSILSESLKGIKSNSAPAASIGGISNVSLEWPLNITSENCSRNVLHVSSQGFHHNGSVIRQGKKVVPGWSFVNEEDASAEQEDTLVGSAKDEDDEDMEDGINSGEKDIGRDECAFKMNDPESTSPSDLPQLNRW